MGRKRKGRDISGWLLVDKPAGITSTAVVNKVKWALNANKAGHCGTLDPEATGVLAIALGEATKTVSYVTEALKCYRFTVRFGAATNTDDAEGEVIAESDLRPSDAEIKDALNRFIGDIEQIPPKFSAVKIDGERAYALARQGENIELASRPLFVQSLLMIDRPDRDHAVLEMVCGKGGYVRSIARDLGEYLSCHGHVQSLRRLWAGPFEISVCIGFELIEALQKTPDLDNHIHPIEVGLIDLPRGSCSQESATRLRNGNPAPVVINDAGYGDICWVAHEGKPVAIGQYRAGSLQPSRVFVLP
ncbi:MAG: tRNA pseudouridine(55) synthase TruB [Paracoccaceae bacterium]